MTPKERVLAALEFREPDRIPWGEHHIDYNVFEMFLGRETLVNAKIRETRAYWDGRRDEIVECYKRDVPDLMRALDMDIVPVREMPDKSYHPKPMKVIDDETYQDENGKIFRISSATGDLMEQHVNTAYRREATIESIEKEIASIEKDRPLNADDAQWDFIKHVVKEMGDTHFIMLLCNGLEFPRFGITEEESWMNLVLEPEISAKIAELQGRQMVREVDFYASLGVDAIMSVGDLGTSSGMLASPKIYREMCKPWQVKQADRAHELGLKVLRHCCGHIWPVIDDIAEINDAYESIQATAGMDIKKLREHCGTNLCLWGGVWHEHIIDGTVEDMRKDVAYSLNYAAKGGGYIMGSSHSLAVGAKKENILEMKRLRDQWGHYPLNPKLWEAYI